MLPRPAFQEQIERNRRTAVEAVFECPKESSEVIRPWGKVGSMRFCVANGVEHGPWAGWENGSHLRGQYIHGKREGEWQWFDRGALTRTTRFTGGIETYDSLADAASTLSGSRPTTLR
jgi:hypothetical protein